MDSFIFKLTNIFDYDGEGSVFQIFKNETFILLNKLNIKILRFNKEKVKP